MADLRITDDEAAILRSWLGGNSPGAIGKARREPEGRIVTVLSRLCGLDRAAGRRVLDSGRRPAPALAPRAAEPPTEPAPDLEPPLPPPTVVGSADVDRAALVTERDQLRADLDDANAERDQLRGQLHDALTSRHELRRQLDELTADARRVAEQRDEALAELHTRSKAPTPLVEYDAWRCPGCGYIGPPSGHRPLPARVCLTPDPDELQPVTVAILPREATP